MIKSGMIIQINKWDGTGIIETKHGQQFFFSSEECVGSEMPKLFTQVTFLKDPDFRQTDVAMLIQHSQIFKRTA